MSKRYVIMWWVIMAALVLAAAIQNIPWQTIAASGTGEETPTLIIDPGHGGADGGAVAPDGTKESELNLDIAKRLSALAGFCGIPAVMTRTDEQISYPAEADTVSQMKKADQHARLELINAQENAVLISIHQNNYPAASPNGIQVFYNGVGTGEMLAKTLQSNLTVCLCPENRRLAEAADDGIYLMHRSNKPAVLIECGFLSNPGDLEKLEDPDYRIELAVVMISSYLQYTRGAQV